MTRRMKRCANIMLLALFVPLSGCATLTVTPLQPVKTTTAKAPIHLGMLVAGERLREALNDPAESAAAAANGALFNKVTVLPQESRDRSPAEIKGQFGADYLMTTVLSDINVHGDLNPYWFASIPLFFFKPYAPIVTFEAVVTLESTVVDLRTGTVVFKKETSAMVTDHFSPIDPQNKVRRLVARGINNALVDQLEETRQKIAVR